MLENMMHFFKDHIMHVLSIGDRRGEFSKKLVG